jgi:hypothetical protein
MKGDLPELVTSCVNGHGSQAVERIMGEYYLLHCGCSQPLKTQKARSR